MMRPELVRYLKYVKNTGGSATIAIFDDDWEPIGPQLRAELMPTYIEEVSGELRLTKAGAAELAKAKRRAEGSET